MKRLIKKAEPVNSVRGDEMILNQDRGQNIMYNIFKNPTSDEIRQAYDQEGTLGISGVITDSGDIYIWGGNPSLSTIATVVPEVAGQLKFGIERGNWFFYENDKYTSQQIMEIIIKNENRFSSIAYLNGLIYVGTEYTFNNIEELKRFVNGGK